MDKIQHYQNDSFLIKLINLMPGNVFWKDSQGRYLGCNINVAKILGYNSPNDIIGKTNQELLGDEFAQAADQTDENVIKNNQSYTLEEPGFNLQGEPAIYLTTKIPLHDKNENVIGVIGISQDITDRKKIEEELKKANQINVAFIENMQHDLRTPAYGVCSGLSDLLKAENDPDKKNHIALIYKSAKQLFKLCLEVTDFDKMEHQNKVITNKKFDLEKLAKNVIELNKTAASNRRLQLNLMIESDVPHIVKGDSYRLKRILINLIGNAIKFTKEGKISLNIKLLRAIEKEQILRFEVSDTGIGIPQDKKDFIYEKFTRGTPANQEVYKGSGLGLRLVKNFVEDLKGDIEVQSSTEMGTTFYITLPFEIPLSDDLLEDQRVGADISLEGDELETNLMIKAAVEFDNLKKNDQTLLMTLLVEDNLLASRAAKNGLESLGCQVVVADSVKSAKEALTITKFDIVISDLGLPDGTGFDVAKYLKEPFQALNYDTPMFALTAHAGKEKLEEAERVGFLALLTKPLLPKEFRKILDKYVARPALQKEKSIIDFEFSKQYGFKEQDCIKFLAALCEELPMDIQLIEQARQKNDIKQLRELMHKFKGGFCYIGVPYLQEATNQLHDVLKIVEDLTEIPEFFNRFYAEANRVIKEFQKVQHTD